MISLKKFLDQNKHVPAAAPEPIPAQPALIATSVPLAAKPEPQPSPIPAAAPAPPRESAVSSNPPDPDPGGTEVGAWRDLLFTVSDAAASAIPPLGPALNQKLSALGRTSLLSAADSLRAANQEACRELNLWAGNAAKFYGEHQQELQEIVAVVARTAETLGQRDERYAQEIGGFATRLRQVSDQQDIVVMRRSIVESAGAVQSCVARMAREGRETARLLNQQTNEYRRRMEEAERISLVDPLTSLLNRRGMDRDLQRRMSAGKPFCVALMDLDKFKSINDSLGHAAGDDLLRQLGSELLTQFPVPDAVARLGGDEFIVVSSGPAATGEAVMARMRQWVLGKYRVSDGASTKVEIGVQASLGTTLWDGRETADALLARADQLMYQNKSGREHEAAPVAA